MITNYQFLKIESLGEGIELVSINRPTKLNALNNDVLEDLANYFRALSPKEVRGVILTGEGEKSFIAGADISGMSEMDSEAGCEFSNKGQKVSVYIEEAPVPVIAAVNGFALGGGLEMALSCDFIYASQNAVFGLPEVSLGLIPGFGGTQRLSKIIGRNYAKEMIYTGKKLTAEEAYQRRLVLKVLPDKQSLLEQCLETFSKILRNSPYAVNQAKKVINEGVDLKVEMGLLEEQKVFAETFDSYDMKEGTKAFVEKRKPLFRGE